MWQKLEQGQFSSYGTLILRLSLATMWISHALLKFMVFTIPGFASWLEAQGLPGFMAWPVFLLEISGGVAILLGIYSRYIAVLLLPIMIVALWTHIPNGWVFTNPNGGWEYPLFLTMTSLAYFLIGNKPVLSLEPNNRRM